MPRLVACGGRTAALDHLRTALRDGRDGFLAMLVDSEAPVDDVERPWDHLQHHDGWERPREAREEHALLMVTCMESWIACDGEALRRRFGDKFRSAALPVAEQLERTEPAKIIAALKSATGGCATRFAKGAVAFGLLDVPDPEKLKTLPSVARTLRILEDQL
jgi:hypothetical protein